MVRRSSAVVPWLGVNDPFPPVDAALREPNGLLAAGADLSVERLLDAYAHGIFPWFGEGDPLLWWHPDPRMVLWFEELHVSRSLRRTLRAQRFRVTLDAAFAAVVAGCAEPQPDRPDTWITAEMAEAYGTLAARGHAHSVEVWDGAMLAGGLYGVALGRMFFGESMFARATDASKIALAHLVKQLERWGFGMIDCQMRTAHLASFGARDIARTQFMRKLAELVNYPSRTGKWRFNHDLFD